MYLMHGYIYIYTAYYIYIYVSDAWIYIYICSVTSLGSFFIKFGATTTVAQCKITSSKMFFFSYEK